MSDQTRRVVAVLALVLCAELRGPAAWRNMMDSSAVLVHVPSSSRLKRRPPLCIKVNANLFQQHATSLDIYLAIT